MANASRALVDLPFPLRLVHVGMINNYRDFQSLIITVLTLRQNEASPQVCGRFFFLGMYGGVQQIQ